MGLRVLNKTTLPVRVIAFLVKDDDSIRVLLTLSRIPVPARPLLHVTLRRDIHASALVPLAHEGRQVRVDNRAPVRWEWKRSAKGDRIIVITGVFC